MSTRSSGNKQDVRRSQFITTYGPGSIIVGPHGPAVVMMPEIGLFKPLGLKPSEFEIECKSLSRMLGGKIYRVPSNQELGYDKPIYRTKLFPEWHLCPENDRHIRYSVLYIGENCPVCMKLCDHREAVRFVMACPKGHLDDVDWERAVHKGETCPKPRGKEPYFLWYQNGPTLYDITISCSSCKESISMGDIFYKWDKCSGRFPEREAINDRPKRPDTCKFKAEMGPDMPEKRKPTVLHRGALNLHIPIPVAAIKIEPFSDRLHQILSDDKVKTIAYALESIGQLNKDQLKTALEKGGISPKYVAELLSRDISEIASSLADVLAPQSSENYTDMLNKEFRALKRGAIEGSSLPDLEIRRSDVIQLVSDGKMAIPLRIAPVSRLKVVMAQRGYVRVDPIEGKTIDVSYEEQLPLGKTEKWFPGVELNGEGIFISVDSSDFRPRGRAELEWAEVYRQCGKGGCEYGENLFRDQDSAVKDHLELHPLFVWWHSFSHRLITWLAIDSGYSAASLRERVYCDGAEGGILLYASQPGGDGSLGGLLGLVRKEERRFERILKDSYISANFCSNDPFCGEMSMKKNSYAGAACYACLLLPETSCEHRNMWLDRRLLLENPLW